MVISVCFAVFHVHLSEVVSQGYVCAAGKATHFVGNLSV